MIKRLMIIALMLCGAAGYAETTITQLAATNVVDYTVLNANWNNLKATVDQLFDDTTTGVLSTNINMRTNDINYIDDLIGVGVGTSYITNFTYYGTFSGNGGAITNVSAIPPANNTTTTNFSQAVTIVNTATNGTEAVNYTTMTNYVQGGKAYADVYITQGLVLTNVTSSAASPDVILLPNAGLTQNVTANGTGVTITVTGNYSVDFIGSFISSAAADVIAEVRTNGVAITNGETRHEISNTGYGNLIKKEMITIQSGVTVDIRIHIDSGAGTEDLTFNDLDLHVLRLDL
jgi:hypothetical protein